MTHHGRYRAIKKPHFCVICRKRYKTKKELDKCKESHPEERWSCKHDSCNHVADSLHALRIHGKKHKVQCNIDGCKKKFRNIDKLNNHKKQRHTESMQCDQCFKYLKNQLVYEQHYKEEHGEDIKDSLPISNVVGFLDMSSLADELENI